VYSGGNITTASTTFVSTGLGVGDAAGFTPKKTGTVLMTLTSSMSNNTANDGFQDAIFYNTTGLPLAGTAVGTDTLVAKAQIPSASVANERRIMAIVALVKGLTPGVTIYPYIAHSAITGGTASTSGVGATIITCVELTST